MDGDKVRDARQRLGLTQAALAARLGVSFVTVNRWERGKSKPPGQLLKQLRHLEAEQTATAPANGNPGRAQGQPPTGGPDFLGDPERVRLIAEVERLSYGHIASPTFATETSRIEPLPHQRIAVYEHMLTQPRLRFLLADDAGAGKTIMSGLYIREMQARRLVRRVLIVPPAGLLGNWEHELRRLFGLHFRIVRGTDARTANPFAGNDGNSVICSIDTLSGESMFNRLQSPEVEPYDLVIVDEAHKLAASRDADLTVDKTDRYKLGEALAGVPLTDSRWALPWSARHLLLLTATPHMGKDFPYYALWRLLEPEVLSTEDAFRAFPPEERRKRFIRRTKEEMVYFDGTPLYPERVSDTLGFDLALGPKSEQELYDRTTAYMRTFYNRAGILSQSAARLALSVFQRRLASSTFAMMRSFERRVERLDEVIERVKEGRLTPQELQSGQQRLFDPFEDSTADEEAASSGREGHEPAEDRLVQLIRTTSLIELQEERREVMGLLDLSRDVLASGQESKFQTLREFLLKPEYRDEKLIVFTEHRDTLDWLRRRLEAMGFTDTIAAIHGAMDFRQRGVEVDRFRRPTEEGGAQYLLATDAAGEGINLQFCWLMVNYDVPWNPARLEQRMGRIHRFGQKHDPVVIVNLIANNTREGLVIGTLLRKLEVIRRELKSDKVYDVVGRVFENVSIASYMADALVQDNAADQATRLEGRLTREQVDAIGERDRVRFGGGGDIRQELPRLRAATEQEALRRLLPGYVRHFVERAAPALGLRLDGDLDGLFSLRPIERGAVDPLWEVFENDDDYPQDASASLTVYRPKGDAAVFVHPGEPVFERLRSLTLDRFSEDARRGAPFIDPTTTDPYLVVVAEFSIIRRLGARPSNAPRAPSSALRAGRPDELLPNFSGGAGLLGACSQFPDTLLESIHNRLVALKVDHRGRFELCPVEHFLLLRGCDRFPSDHVGFAARAAEIERLAGEFLRTNVAEPLLAERQDQLRSTLSERESFLARGFDFQAAELAASRKGLTEKVQQGQATARIALERVKEHQRAVEQRKAAAVAALRAEPEELAVGDIVLLARALVVPSSVTAEIERYDAHVEAIAMQVARAFEEAAGATVHDVSTAPKARAAGLNDYPGFDLLAEYPSGQRRSVEVKGRARTGDVDVSANEWSQACNLRDAYWLHVVFDCATAHPRLVRVQNPFAKLLAKSGGVIVTPRDILAAAETGWAPTSAASPLPELLRPLFWDHRVEDLRWPTHRDLVIGRVLQSGGTDAIAWLRSAVPDVDLAAWIRSRDGHGLDARQLRFWQVVLKLPEADVDGWVARFRSSPWGMRHNASGVPDDTR